MPTVYDTAQSRDQSGYPLPNNDFVVVALRLLFWPESVRTILLVGAVSVCIACGNDQAEREQTPTRATTTQVARDSQQLPLEGLEDSLDFEPVVHPDREDQLETAGVEAPDPIRRSFSRTDTVKLRNALAIARSATKDTIFGQVLRRLAAANRIDWGARRLGRLPREQQRRPTAFLLEEYARRGHYQLSNLSAWEWIAKPSVTGSTTPCGPNSRVNEKKLSRTTRSVAGTMVHERAHTFCMRHNSNDITKNRCDFAYIAGDLAIAIAQYRANGSRPIRKPIGPCSKLINELIATRVVQP